MTDALVFVVDDDPHLRRLLEVLLKTKGYRVRSFENGEKCLKALDENPATIFLDLMMPGLDGTQTLKEIRKTNPDLPVIMVTSVDDVNTAVEVIKLGADDYILKPFDEARLLTNLEKAIQKNSLVNRVKHLEEELHGVYQFEGIIGKSPAIQKVLEKIHKVKDSKASVLIEGESGTGKELIARAIHYNSRFANGLFVDINCGAIPETLQESELFGHRKGAFTGALESRIGKLERADGGTLFLDEVAEMSANSQTKLLRFLQEKTFERIGENTKISVDTRVISATNKDLKAEVEKRNFREDLYYRLAVFPIRVPPLRERREDISLLCAHLLEKFRRELDKEVRTLSPAAMDCLMQFSWPGNVRQLENALYQGMINTDSSTIDVQHLPVEIQRADSQTLPTPGSDGDSTPPSTPEISIPILPLKELERRAVAQALEATGGHIPKAAELLKLSRSTFYRMVKKYGLDKKP